MAATQFPRLLAGLSADGPLDHYGHESLHGEPLAVPGPLRGRGQSHPLILELERAGLRGHGGAGFPTATKLDAVAAKGSKPMMVVNASEGEPLSRKDGLLLRRVPHLVLDGVVAAAALLGSEEIVIAIDQRAGAAARAVSQAVAERADLNARHAPRVEVAPVPWGYLTGQEAALVNVLGGGPAKPTMKPPYVFERGLKGRPTLLSNAETYAHIGLIARHGADWYCALGSPSAPGTRLVTVGGAVAYPGVVEVPGGTSLERLVEASGGLTEPLQGVLLGGYAGTWLGPQALELTLDEYALRERSLTLGAGIVFLLPRSACVVSEVANVTAWLFSQSARQCGPCEHGLAAIAQALAELTVASGYRDGYGQVERWCWMVNKRGACALPDGAARFVTSALQTFRAAFEDHARHGACEACHSPYWLPTDRSRSGAPAPPARRP